MRQSRIRSACGLRVLRVRADIGTRVIEVERSLTLSAWFDGSAKTSSEAIILGAPQRIGVLGTGIAPVISARQVLTVLEAALRKPTAPQRPGWGTAKCRWAWLSFGHDNRQAVFQPGRHAIVGWRR